MLVALALVLANLLVYGQLVHSQFLAFDDNLYVTDNAIVKAGLTWKGVVFAFTSVSYFYWHPLTWLSHMLDAQLFGGAAGFHHLTSVAIHVLNSLLVFAVFRWSTGAFWRSAVLAALFALHPQHVESVAWIAERKDVLSAFFWLCATAAYLWYTERRSGSRYALLVAAFLMALMAKPMALTLPLVLLLMDYWPLQRFRPGEHGRLVLGRLILEKLPLAALSLGSAVVTYVGQRNMGALRTLAAVPFTVKISNALLNYVKYLRDFLWPQGLAILYPLDRSTPVWQGWAAGLLLAAISVAVLRARKRHPYLVAGWLWWLVVLLPTIGLVSVGGVSRADRFMYLPSLGLLTCVVWGAADWLQEWPRRFPRVGHKLTATVAATLAGLAIALCGLCSYRQTGYWRDTVTVFQRADAVTRNNMVAYYTLGNEYNNQRRIPEAIRQYRRALQVDPRYPEALYGLGFSLEQLGQPSEAAALFSAAVEAKPGYALAWLHLGRALMQTGHREEGEKALAKAAQLK
ncbi:MAG TPA: tetratricopeptide repeat protein [Candidatus Acidoferrales bacterium]|nr:tetratricopeptide repeat protein [Candidatus Acidoferrales bacterium]